MATRMYGNIISNSGKYHKVAADSKQENRAFVRVKGERYMQHSRHSYQSFMGTAVAPRIACFGVAALLLLVPLAASPTEAAPDAGTVLAAPVNAHAQIAAQYGTMPLAFEANVGQTDPNVRFVAHAHGFALALAPDALTVVVSNRQSAVGSKSARHCAPSPPTSPLPPADCQSPTDSLPTPPLRFAFAGANPAPLLAAEEPLPGVTNYLIGNDPALWHTNVPTAARVRYTALYPGIDLTVYGTDAGGLEYDALIAPGADPAAFALAITGADAVQLDDATGELVMTTAAGAVRQHAPVAYQERDGQRLPVDARYAVRGDGSVGFAMGAYDATLPLVIDPTVTLAYSTYLGGAGDDTGIAIAVDTSGNAYITGITASVNFPTLHAYQTTYGGGSTDAFVTKLNATGTALVYSTFLHGSVGEYGNGIAVDTSGNAYITGITGSANFPTLNAYRTTFGGGITDAFVTKLDTTKTGAASLVYSTYLGGAGSESGYGIAVDTSGNAYITGDTSANFPTLNAYQTTNGGITDAFVTKLTFVFPPAPQPTPHPPAATQPSTPVPQPTPMHTPAPTPIGVATPIPQPVRH